MAWPPFGSHGRSLVLATSAAIVLGGWSAGILPGHFAIPVQASSSPFKPNLFDPTSDSRSILQQS